MSHAFTLLLLAEGVQRKTIAKTLLVTYTMAILWFWEELGFTQDVVKHTSLMMMMQLQLIWATYATQPLLLVPA